MKSVTRTLKGSRAPKPGEMPVMKEQCKTCPFRDGGDPRLRARIEQDVLTKASQTCHSTGVMHGKRYDTHLCRGARDFQLTIFYRLGVIEAPTDEAWAKAVKEMTV